MGPEGSVQLLRVECRLHRRGQCFLRLLGFNQYLTLAVPGCGAPSLFVFVSHTCPAVSEELGCTTLWSPPPVVWLSSCFTGDLEVLYPPAQHTLSTVNPKSHRLAALCFCVQGLEPLPPLTAQTVLLRLSCGPRVVCSTFRIRLFNPSNYPCERVVLLLFDVSSNSSSPCCF